MLILSPGRADLRALRTDSIRNPYLPGSLNPIMRPALHFVGFRDDRYWAAVRVWGRPDYIHLDWDVWAKQATAPGDTIVFANGESDQAVRRRA